MFKDDTSALIAIPSFMVAGLAMTAPLMAQQSRNGMCDYLGATNLCLSWNTTGGGAGCTDNTNWYTGTGNGAKNCNYGACWFWWTDAVCVAV